MSSMSTARIVRVELADPFDSSKLFGTNAYSVNNMELIARRFPSAWPEDAPHHSLWLDRLCGEEYQAWNRIWNEWREKSCPNAGGGFDMIVRSMPFEWLLEAFAAIDGGFVPTGYRFLRFTNASTLYPAYLLNVVRIEEGAEGVEWGPTIHRLNPPSCIRHIDEYGRATWDFLDDPYFGR